MLTLVSSNVGYSGEDICTMGCAAFDAISVVYTTFSCLMVDIEILKIVVKIDGAGAEIAAKKSGVSGEYGSDVDVSFPTKWDSNTGLPLVKVGNDCGG
jgi:hypothetical protein